MSRVLNIDATEAEVQAMCKKHNAVVSAIEPFPGGGTRLVLMNTSDKETLSRAFGKKIITGVVARTPFSQHRPR